MTAVQKRLVAKFEAVAGETGIAVKAGLVPIKQSVPTGNGNGYVAREVEVNGIIIEASDGDASLLFFPREGTGLIEKVKPYEHLDHLPTRHQAALAAAGMTLVRGSDSHLYLVSQHQQRRPLMRVTHTSARPHIQDMDGNLGGVFEERDLRAALDA